MYECAMAGQNICKWVGEHIRRCGHWCQEREKLYYEIRNRKKRVVSLQATAESILNTVYEGRVTYISNHNDDATAETIINTVYEGRVAYISNHNDGVVDLVFNL